MKYFLLLAFALLAGCESTSPDGKTKYTRIVATDPSGDRIAEWIAEGRVKKTDQGYDIQAVERKSGQPFPISTRFPNRRAATVVGTHIVLEEIDKPAWLSTIDDTDDAASAGYSR